MIFIIDRFEGNYAVLECGENNIFDVPRGILPVEAKEGDAIEINISQTFTNKKYDNLFKK